MTRALLDTNALIDLTIARTPQNHSSLMRALERGGSEDEYLVPTLALKDLSYYIENNRQIREVIPSRKERIAIAAQARSILFDQCTICAVDEAVARKAHADLNEQDYDDALIAACAELSGADVIISSDKKAFQDSTVPSMTPVEFELYLRLRDTGNKQRPSSRSPRKP